MIETNWKACLTKKMSLLACVISVQALCARPGRKCLSQADRNDEGTLDPYHER